MRKIIFFLLMLVVGSAAFGQSSLYGNMLFLQMPSQDTTHKRSVKCYELSDKVMGKRTLKHTQYYDRHGFRTSPTEKAAYDSLGRLTHYMTLEQRTTISGPMKVYDTVDFNTVRYTPEGWVDRYRYLSYSRISGVVPDTTMYSYRLAASSLDERGNQRLEYHVAYSIARAKVYGEIPSSSIDTMVLELRRDEHGQVVSESLSSTSYALHSYFINTYYDNKGRKAHCKGVYDTWMDTVTYQYNILGQLIGWTGKVNDEGVEGDIIVRCRPDGTMTEMTLVWFEETFDPVTEEFVPTQQTHHYYYDDRGNLIREEHPDQPVLEYDIDYWD